MFKEVSKWSPVVREGIPPRDSMYYESFWDDNYALIMNGYTNGNEKITGDHYWYLNFWKIRGTNNATGRKEIIHPRFIDLDHEYFHVFDKARSLNKNLAVVKGRQQGFTEKHASIGGKEFTFFKASQTIYVAGLEFYSDMIFNSCIRGLNDLYETEFYKRRFPDRDDYTRAAFLDEVEDDDGNTTKVIRGYLSEVFKITAKNNPQAVSSRSPSFIVFEESGAFGGVIATYGYIKPSMYSEAKKTGMAVFVGTGGEMGKGAEELEYIYYHPEEFDCLTFDLSQFDKSVARGTKSVGFFSSAAKYHIIDSDGNSLIEASTKDRLKARELQKGKMKEYHEITQHPLIPSEAFLIQGGGFFGPQVSLLLNKRKTRLNQEPILSEFIEWGKLDWLYDDHENIVDVKWINDTNGPFMIIEHPEWRKNMPEGESGTVIDNMYKAGTDSYDKDEANTSTSKGSTHIYKGFVNATYSARFWVARLIERPEEAETFYENSAKLCFYYNARNLIEYSNIRIFDWWKKNGFESLLRERPEFVLASWIKQSKVENRYGIDPSTKLFWLGLLKKWLLDPFFVDHMYDIDQINAFLKFKLDPKYNCDITISSALCAVQEQEDKEMITHDPIPDQIRRPMARYKTVNGVMIKMID